MRLPSAFVVLAVAAFAAGCSIPVAPSPKPDPAIAALKDLGVDGRTYVSDLGADRAFRLNRVFPAGDDLVIEDISGGLTYIDGKTLMPRWAYFGLPRTFDEAPDASETLFVGVAKSKVYVLSRRTGAEVIAPSEIAVVPSAGAVANETTLYVPTYRTPSGNKTVVSVNLADGYVGWGFQTGDDVEVDLAKGGPHGGDMMYVASAAGVLYGVPTYAATARTTDPSWTVNLRSGVHKQITVAGDDLGVVTDDHRLMCLDRITGTIRWEVYPSSGEQASSGAQFSSKQAFFVCGGETRAYDRATGAMAWSAKGGWSFVAERGTRTIFADGKGTLAALDTATGKVLGTKSMPGWTFPARHTPDATIVGISNAGMVVSVETGW